jgi:CheY-like chemotaxis protein
MFSSATTAATRRVLIVDDSRAIIAILRRVVQEAGGSGVEVRGATNGQEALDLVDSFSPDLIITDWHMPGVTGIEMLQTLRQTGHAQVRVGFVTAENSPSRLAEARSNGADFVVTKPFQDEELLKAVRLSLAQAPARPGAPPAAAGPVKPEVIERLLKVALKQLAFDVRPCEPMMPGNLTPFLLRCQYAQGSDTVPTVIGLLDFPALCVIGAGSGADAAHVAAAAIAKGRPDPEVVQRAGTFMRIASKLIQGHSDANPYRLLRAQVVSRGVGELDELLPKATERTDVMLEVPGCGAARVTYLKVPLS